MMHIVGSTPKSPTRSNPKTTLEDRLVDNPDLSETVNDPSIDPSIVTIEVPSHHSIEEDSPIADSTPKAVRPTFASKNNLTALNVVKVTPEAPEAPKTNPTTPDQPSDPASVTDLIHAINLVPARQSKAAPTQITPYSVHNTHRYLQPYPLNAPPSTPSLRSRPTPKLPWLECGGGLAAFTIISGVVAIDGLKQTPSGPRPTTAQQTRPTIARLPQNPNALPQVSVSELMNSGRTLPVPAGAMNFPGQVALNPAPNSPQNSTAPNRGLNLGTAEMNSIVIQKDLTPQATQPETTPLQAPPRRKQIAPPETTPLPQQSVQQLVQPVPQPVQPVPQPVQPIQEPVLTPQATQTSEIPSSAMPPSQSTEPKFLEPTLQPSPNPTTSSAPLQNQSIKAPTLKPIRSSTELSPNGLSSVILEADPQSAVSSTSTTSNDALRLEVSKL